MKPKSLILELICKPLFLFINIFAIYLFLKGHNEPGGGFIAGIASSLSFVIVYLILGNQELKKIIPIDPAMISVAGIFIAYITAFTPVLLDFPFLYHKMLHLHLPILGDQHLGSPFLFDVGVYLAVIGVTTKIIFVFNDTVNGKQSRSSK